MRKGKRPSSANPKQTAEAILNKITFTKDVKAFSKESLNLYSERVKNDYRKISLLKQPKRALQLSRFKDYLAALQKRAQNTATLQHDIENSTQNFKKLIINHKDTPEVKFLLQLIQKINNPKVVFGIRDRDAEYGHYEKDGVHVDVDKHLETMKYDNTNYELSAIGTLMHEFLHYYDDRESIKSFFKNQYGKMVSAINSTKGQNELFKSVFDRRMDLIAAIMESIEPGQMVSYLSEETIKSGDKAEDKNRKERFNKKLKNSDFKFEHFMTEIIPNILSATAFKSDEARRNEFSLNCMSAAYQNKEIFATAGQDACAFLQSFFTEYQKAARQSGLQLPGFLQKGMSDVISTYTQSKQNFLNSTKVTQGYNLQIIPLLNFSNLFKALNAAGNDHSLEKEGSNSLHYWYSFQDVTSLLTKVRELNLTFPEGQVVNPGEEHSAFRENTQGVLLMDPCHPDNFDNSLKDAVGWIVGKPLNPSVENKGKWKWNNKPNTIIIPLCDGAHWRNIRVQINGNKCNILYDDPFGQNGFSKELKKKLQESIRSNVATLTDQPNIESFTAEKSFPQQKNGWDCGPICLSNIRDYVKGENIGKKNFAFLVNDNFTIKEAKGDLIEQRAKDIVSLDTAKNVQAVQVSLTKDVTGDSKNSKNKSDDFDLIFKIAQNYKQAFPDKTDKNAINYAIQFREDQKNQQYSQQSSMGSSSIREKILEKIKKEQHEVTHQQYNPGGFNTSTRKRVASLSQNEKPILGSHTKNEVTKQQSKFLQR